MFDALRDADDDHDNDIDIELIQWSSSSWFFIEIIILKMTMIHQILIIIVYDMN